MRSGVGQRAGASQHRRLVQRAEQRFGGESLRREGRLEAGGEGIVQVSLQATHDLKLGNYTIPVYAKGMWNPQSNQSYFQIGAEIIRF